MASSPHYGLMVRLNGVNSVSSERRPESICRLRSRLIAYTPPQSGGQEGESAMPGLKYGVSQEERSLITALLNWIPASISVFALLQNYKSVQYSAVFDMCNKGFFALLWCFLTKSCGALMLLNVCFSPEPCHLTHAHIRFVQVCIHRAAHTERIPVPTASLRILPHFSELSGIFMYTVHIVRGGQAEAPTYWKIWRRG